MPAVRIGIVGCGRILAAHLRGYQLLRAAGVDNFRITALCARRDEDAQMYVHRGRGPAQRPPVSNMPGDPLAVGDIYLSDFQDGVDVQIFTDYRQMIAAGPIDAVNDFTTHAMHDQVANCAFGHAKHLLVQKPLAVSLPAARQMCEQAEKASVVLAVFENARNRPDARYLHWLFHCGHYGRLQMLVMANVGNWWAPDQIVARTPWRHQAAEAGGITLDIGVHIFHLIRHLAGEIRTVSARTAILEPHRATRDTGGKVLESVDCDADDTMLVHFETEENVIGSLAASWAGRGRGTATAPGRGIVYYGSAGSVHGGDFYDDSGRQHSLESLYKEHCPADIRERDFPLGLKDAFALNQYDWLEAIRTGRAPETSGREGLRDLAVAQAVLQSARTGRPVEVDKLL